MNKGDISIFSVTASHGTMHAYLVLLPALIPLLGGELGNLAMVGFLLSLAMIFYGWGSFPAGFLADVTSKKMLIILSMILCGGSAIIVSLSYNLWMTVFGMIFLGIGASLYHPCGYSHMALCSDELRGRYMGIQGIGGDLGMAVAYITSTILGSTIGWRSTFLLWGILGLLIGAVDWLTIIDIEHEIVSTNMRKGYVETLRRMFETEHRSALFLVFLVIVLSGALWTGVSSWILTYINRTKNVAFIIAGGLSTLQYTIGAFAQIAGGEYSDKIGRKKILLGGFGTFSVSLFLLTLAPGDFWSLLVLVSMLGFAFFVTQAPINALLGDVSNRDTVGVTYGVNFTVKYGIGAILPSMAGWIAVAYGLDFVFYFFSILSALAFFITLFIREVKTGKI